MLARLVVLSLVCFFILQMIHISSAAHAYDPPTVIIKTFRPAFDRLKFYTTTSAVDQSNRYDADNTQRRRRRHFLRTLGHRLQNRTLTRSAVRGLDLYFLFDASGSIDLKEFKTSTQFAMRLVREVSCFIWGS